MSSTSISTLGDFADGMERPYGVGVPLGSVLGDSGAGTGAVVGSGVGAGVAVSVGVGVGVAVRVAVSVVVGAGVAVSVDVGVAAWVGVGSSVGVGLGSSVGVGLGFSVGVGLGFSVCVGVDSCVGEGDGWALRASITRESDHPASAYCPSGRNHRYSVVSSTTTSTRETPSGSLRVGLLTSRQVAAPGLRSCSTSGSPVTRPEALRTTPVTTARAPAATLVAGAPMVVVRSMPS
ncbi:hypothetical protein DDE18_11655 [Nocardioides gansuensis]|uniref:Uncharacterized protein n=1 Tax=Nocardioides gansuensis TaxID=2138300 RepID=A0A2T8FBA4_9ACTN|nr:hypothetical protein DDE18_11655 [Nocardioides gansuensis]